MTQQQQQPHKTKMIADAKFFHEGKRLISGDEFETDIGNAQDLVAMRFAHFKPTTLSDLPDLLPGRRRGTYQRHDLQAEETKDPTPQPATENED